MASFDITGQFVLHITGVGQGEDEYDALCDLAGKIEDILRKRVSAVRRVELEFDPSDNIDVVWACPDEDVA